ncbi:hypothetical protein ABPG74_016575 [Tetrahymena malaccensis]
MEQNKNFKQFGFLDNQKEENDGTIQKGQKQSKPFQTQESNYLDSKYQISDLEQETTNDQKLIYYQEQTIQNNQKKNYKEQKISNNSNQIEIIQIEEVKQQDNQNQIKDFSKNQENFQKQQKNINVIEQKLKENTNKANMLTLNSNDDSGKIQQEQENLQLYANNLKLKKQAQDIIKSLLDNQTLVLSKEKLKICQQNFQDNNEKIIFNPVSQDSIKKIEQSDKQNDSIKQNSEKEQILQDNYENQNDFQNFNQSCQIQQQFFNSALKSNTTSSENNFETDQCTQQSKDQSQLCKILLEGINIKKFIKSEPEVFTEKIRKKLEEKYYYVTEYIASGGEADIFKCCNQDKNYALKFVIYNEENKQDVEKEYELISSIKQQINLTRYVDQIAIPDENLIIIVTDLYQQSLQDYLNKPQIFDIDTFVSFIFDMIDGLIELRCYNIQHFDIKPQNILLDENLNLYFNDFGLSNKLKHGQSKVPSGFTPGFCSQEQQSYQQIDHYQSDIFSLGKTFERLNQDFIKEVYYSYSFSYLKLYLFMYNINIPQDANLENEDALISIVSQNLNKNFLFALYLIAHAYYIQSKYQQSAKLFYTCYQFGIQLQEDFSFLMNLVNGIGSCYMNLGLYKEAQALYAATFTQLKDIIDKLLFPVQFQIANNYAECLLISGKIDEAEQLYLQIKQKYEQLGNTNSFDYCQILNNIATYQNDKRQYKESIQNYKIVLQIKRKLLKNDVHPSMAITYNNIGSCYQELFQISQNQFIEQDKLFSFLKSIIEVQDLPQKEQLNFENLCQLQNFLYKQAQENIQLSVDVMEQIYYKKSNYYLSQFLNNLATLYSQKEQYEQSIIFFEKSLQMKLQMEDPYQIALAYFNLADVYIFNNLHEKAKQYYKKTIQILKENEMIQKEIYSQALNSYGKILENLDYKEAINYLIEAARTKEMYSQNTSDPELEEFINDVINYSDQLDFNQIESCHQQLDEFVEFLDEIQSKFYFSSKVLKMLKEINDQKQDKQYSYVSVKDLEKLLQIYDYLKQ